MPAVGRKAAVQAARPIGRMELAASRLVGATGGRGGRGVRRRRRVSMRRALVALEKEPFNTSTRTKNVPRR